MHGVPQPGLPLVAAPGLAAPMLAAAAPAVPMQMAGIDPSTAQALLLLQQSQQQQLLQQQQAMLPQAQAMLASQLTLQAAQAYDQSVSQTIDPEVTELAHKFKLDERITRDLDVQMKKRQGTFEDDMKALWEILEGARNPAGLLRVKIREMEEGSFRGTATPDKDVEDLAKKFSLDAQASAKLAEVLSKRDNRGKDLRQIAKHLELSNKPSSLVMLMLKDLRAGISVKDPEYPAAVGSYAHKRGLTNRRRSRSRDRDRRRRRQESDSSSSPPPPDATAKASARRSPPRPPGTGTPGGSTRPMTLLERFG